MGDVLLFEGRGEIDIKVAVVSKTRSIKPAGGTRVGKVGNGVRGLVLLGDIGQSEIAIHGEEPG